MHPRDWILEFRVDDLSGEPTRRLVARHLAGMRANSPVDGVFALDVDALEPAGRDVLVGLGRR